MITQEKDKEKNCDFSAVHTDGKTIYYKITFPDTVKVTNNDKRNGKYWKDNEC
jgi:hypothetical protein